MCCDGQTREASDQTSFLLSCQKPQKAGKVKTLKWDVLARPCRLWFCFLVRCVCLLHGHQSLHCAKLCQQVFFLRMERNSFSLSETGGGGLEISSACLVLNGQQWLTCLTPVPLEGVVFVFTVTDGDNFVFGILNALLKCVVFSLCSQSTRWSSSDSTMPGKPPSSTSCESSHFSLLQSEPVLTPSSFSRGKKKFTFWFRFDPAWWTRSSTRRPPSAAMWRK